MLSPKNLDHDLDAEEFRQAVSSSTTDIFQKVSNPQQIIKQRGETQQTLAAAHSPYRTKSLVSENEPAASDISSLRIPELSESLRKRSCPGGVISDSIPEHHSTGSTPTTPVVMASKLKQQQLQEQLQELQEQQQKQALRQQIQQQLLAPPQPGFRAQQVLKSPSKAAPPPDMNSIDFVDAAVRGGGGGRSERQIKHFSKRMASDTDLWLNLQAHQDRYSKIAGISRKPAPAAPVNSQQQQQQHLLLQGESSPIKEKERIFINRVEMPPGPVTNPKETGNGAPTPMHKRVLDQEEFNKKLRAKRAIFSKSRSLSLASFKNLTVAIPKKPKLLTIQLDKIGGKLPDFSVPAVATGRDRDQEYLKKHPVMGELDLLNLESLINVNDVGKPPARSAPIVSGAGGLAIPQQRAQRSSSSGSAKGLPPSERVMQKRQSASAFLGLKKS